MVYPTKLNYKCSRCKGNFAIYRTPKLDEKKAKPFPNVRCPECGGKANYINGE